MIKKFVFISVLVLVLLFLALMLYLVILRPDMIVIIAIYDAIVIFWTIVLIISYLRK